MKLKVHARKKEGENEDGKVERVQQDLRREQACEDLRDWGLLNIKEG